ncbi:MAG TPA: HAD-IIIA family hydrolase [Gemmatimonadaceae bacterium]|nr:HAD-IIIA family hydrolase [Gemmatimonadaceae bacterium]
MFLDRDGTVNVDTGYVSRARDVILIPGAAKAIARLNAAGIPVVIVTNQSGIGRGLLRQDDYAQVRDRVAELLHEHAHARVDATYECPHDPRVGECACRKPGTALFVRAGLDLELALDRSWFIGDRWRDVAPALDLGGFGILVPGAGTPDDDVRMAHDRARVADTLNEAVDAVLASLAPVR